MMGVLFISHGHPHFRFTSFHPNFLDPRLPIILNANKVLCGLFSVRHINFVYPFMFDPSDMSQSNLFSLGSKTQRPAKMPTYNKAKNQLL